MLLTHIRNVLYMNENQQFRNYFERFFDKHKLYVACMLVFTRSIDIMHSRMFDIQIRKIVIVVVLLSPDSNRPKLFDDPHTFYYNDYVAFRRIRSYLEVFSDPMFLWISSNSYPLNSLLFEATKQR